MKPISQVPTGPAPVGAEENAAGVTGTGGAASASTGGKIPQNVLQGLDKASQAFSAFREASQLNTADNLVRDAYSRVQDPNASLVDKLTGQMEMQMASQIRQQVASEVPQGDRQAIQMADAEQQLGFGMVQSNSPLVRLAGDAFGIRGDENFKLIGCKLREDGQVTFGDFIHLQHCDGHQLSRPNCPSPFPPCTRPPEPWSVTNSGNGKADIDLGDYTLKLNKGDSSWTLHNKATGADTKVWGDPHVSEDGKNWTFKNNTTFQLDDGTSITVKTTPYGNGQTLSNELDITKGSQSIKVTGLAQNSKDPLTVAEGFNGWQLAATNLGDPMVFESGKQWLGTDGKVVDDAYAQTHKL